jgi:hypothetical protein
VFRRCQRSAVEEIPAVGEGFALLCSDAASAACWSASGIARCATFLPLTHGRPPTVRVPIAGAVASSGAAKGRLLYQRRLSVIFSRCAPVQGCHGGLTPPALGCTCVCASAKVAISPARVRAFKQERRASARRGWRKRTCNGASTKLRQTADGACADRRCSRVQRRREGPTVVPTPAFRDFQSLCSRAGLPRGANAPRSCVPQKSHERRASARVGVDITRCRLQFSATAFAAKSRVLANVGAGARGANAPRSWFVHAFVHRESRYFVGTGWPGSVRPAQRLLRTGFASGSFGLLRLPRLIQGVRSPRLPDYKRHQTCNRAWPAGVRASNAS